MSERLYRVLWIRCDERTGEATGDRGILFPGPLTHAEACTCMRKVTAYPWRRLMLEELPEGTLTADTITDAQIRALREPASEFGEGVYTEHEHLGAAEVLNLCDEALGDFDYGERLAGMSPEWFAMRKRDARSRCAEIMNERASSALADGGGS